ncbi:5-oxoprolinase subunit PxpB [Pricia sp. S334]|uniref:5-oxoprolinase subunit PxpB n=1 Tax=Pricia mediterranea TaxID=3076079 RepID=A0ABU3LAR8_9FLAO|nr:5-oxoprolinase subunit PxpB [Pricia sp. S334]MDT7830488.1 5-oxoprolinase subunit PxpB [Pricia sp. S334]
MSSYDISIRPFGIHSILVEWPDRVDEAILEDILEFIEHLEQHCLNEEKWEIVPAYNSLTLIDWEKPIAFDELKSKLLDWYAADKEGTGREKLLWRLPVCYDLEFGFDLKEVSQRSGRSVEEVVKLHTESRYTVYGIGFLPGFMYLGGIPETLEIPRKPKPRPKVPKGSVGLAGKQTGIYPQDSPGGWNIIGNCSVPMFDPKKEEPCFVNVGDKVQFYPIERAEYDLHKIEGEVGIYKVEKIILNA